NIVSGAGRFEIRGVDRVTSELFTGLPFRPVIRLLDTRVDRDAHHTNVYLYSYIKLLKNATFTVAGSGDFFEAEDRTAKDKDQFNPKFGITWNPFPDTTLRAAAFRSLKRTLVTNQTIEPTQIAG